MIDVKVSRKERNDRVEVILSLLIMGFTRREICQFVAKRDPSWDISVRTVDRYIHEAYKKIEKAADVKADKELGLGLARLEALFKRTVSIQDYKTALSVQRERHELLGLKKQIGLGDGEGFKIELTLVGSKDDKGTVED